MVFSCARVRYLACHHCDMVLIITQRIMAPVLSHPPTGLEKVAAVGQGDKAEAWWEGLGNSECKLQRQANQKAEGPPS